MAKNVKKTCCICGKKFKGWGNNPWPVKDEGECCDSCNNSRVLLARMRRLFAPQEQVEDIVLTKHSNGDHLSWTYKGVEYEAQGEFFIDKEDYLHHSFTSLCGDEIEFKVKYNN